MSTQLTLDMVSPVLNDLNTKLAGKHAARVFERLKRLLRERYLDWEFRDGLIYITLPPSDGLSGKERVRRMREAGRRVNPEIEKFFESSDFTPTNGDIRKLVGLPRMFRCDDDRLRTQNIQAEGIRRGWKEVHPEAMCVIGELCVIDDLDEMDGAINEGYGVFGLVGVSKPIMIEGKPRWLYVNKESTPNDISAYRAEHDKLWSPEQVFLWSL